MSLLKAMQNLIRVCQLCGIVPISADSKTRNWELNRSIEVLTIIFLFINWTIVLIFLILPKSSVMATTVTIQISVNTFWIIMIYIQSSAVLIEAFFNRRLHKKLLTILRQLESIFQNHLNNNLDFHRVKQAALKAIWFWVFQAFGFSLLSMIVICILKKYLTIPMLLFLTPAPIFTELHLAYVVFLVSVIQENLNVLTNYVKSQIKENGFYPRYNRMLDKSALHLLSQIYSNIWELSTIVNDMTRWSMPIGFMNEAFVLLFNAFWLYVSLKTSSNLQVYVATLLLIRVLGRLLNIFWISNACTNCYKAVSSFQTVPISFHFSF